MDERLEIRLSGSGGQGLILAASILSGALVAEGRTVAQSQSYEPTSRGGLSRSDLVVSDGLADFPLALSLDYLVILDQVAVGASVGMISNGATIVTDAKTVTEPPTGEFQLIELPVLETAIELGNRRIANTIALGALSALGKLCNQVTLEKTVTARSPAAFVDLNREALARGWRMAEAP